MARILRGDIVWADLNPTLGHEQSGQRTVLVISHDVFNEHSGTVIAVALTSQPATKSRFSSYPCAVPSKTSQEIMGQNQPNPDTFY